MGELHGLAVALLGHLQDRLAQRDPCGAVGLVAVQVMSFGGMAHGQNQVSPVGGLVPGGRHGDVQTDLLLVAEHLYPTEAVGIGPDGIEDPREVDVDFAPTLFEKVGQQKAHLVVAQRVLGGEMQFVPRLLRRRPVEQLRVKLAPGAGARAAVGPDCPHQDTQQM